MDSEREIGALDERLVEREVVHSSKYLTFARDIVRDADGQRHAREIVIHPGAVAVVALLPNGHVLLVRQYRHAADRVLLELPAGTLDRQPDGSLEDPQHAARRELLEETGHRAAQWREIVGFYTAPGFATERITLFLATDVSPDPQHSGPQPDERLEVVTMPFAQLLEQGRRGEIEDAKTLVGLYAVDALGRGGEVAELRAR